MEFKVTPTAHDTTSLRGYSSIRLLNTLYIIGCDFADGASNGRHPFPFVPKSRVPIALPFEPRATPRLRMDTLLLDARPPLAIVTLNRPKVLNALNAATFAELNAVFGALAADPAIRVILLAGAGGRAFAAGADIGELANATAEDGAAFSLCGQQVFPRIETLGKPVIACIQGFALGGGCELAMACTLRLAADDAHFGQPEVKLGVIPGYGGTQRLPRLVGRGAALKLLLTGEMIPAEESLRIGRVDEVVPAGELMPRAEALALKIAAQAPLAVAETLRAVAEGLDLTLPEALRLEAEHFGRLCGTADKAEGTRAFLEKRVPVWQGQSRGSPSGCGRTLDPGACACRGRFGLQWEWHFKRSRAIGPRVAHLQADERGIGERKAGLGSIHPVEGKHLLFLAIFLPDEVVFLRPRTTFPCLSRTTTSTGTRRTLRCKTSPVFGTSFLSLSEFAWP
jgi:enoyl-CoA hydratase